MDDANEPLILGGELAAAQAREDAHHFSWPSPLAGVHYPDAAVRLWRWVEASQDAEVAAFVSGYARLDAAQRERTRDNLTMDDLYLLIMYARRSALAALRTRDPAHVASAYDALSAITLDRIDWRDGSWAASIVTHAGQRLGVDTGAMAAGPASRADKDVADLLAWAAGQEVDLSGDWGLREVQTADGIVLLDTEAEPYAPRADLTSMALTLAEAMEADSVTVAGEFHATWVGGEEALVSNLTGCASVHANLREQDSLLAFLAEAPTESQAQSIVRAAEETNEAFCTASAGRVCIVLTVSGHQGKETTATLARFKPLLDDLLSAG